MDDLLSKAVRGLTLASSSFCEMPDSRLGQTAKHPDSSSCGFPESLQMNSLIVNVSRQIPHFLASFEAELPVQ
jgi:hypothetical protein